MNRILIAGSVVVAAGVATLAFLSWKASEAAAKQLHLIVEEVRLELEQDEPERAELTRLRRVIDEAIAADRLEKAPLYRARAHVVFELGGNDDQAYEDIAGLLALSANPAPEDRLLGARILARKQLSVEGRTEDGLQALQLVEDAIATSEPSAEALELGWLVAYRVGDGAAWKRLGDQLTTDLPGSIQAALVDRLRGFLAAQLALRNGLAVDKDALEQAIAGDDESLSAIATVALDAAGRTAATVSDLERTVEARRGPTPPELDFALGFMRLQPQLALDDAAARDALEIDRARQDVALALRKAPQSIGARHTMLVIELARGRNQAAANQARWLIENAAGADARRPLWQRVAGA